ncbi:hypothetical protein [Alkalihalobacillus sp. AL-G]|uniref:hypothetical protein n=1 Tax=Alkalihalobacillus sp. AL-G TaxID=2926399 RepID=UPI0027299BB6|nr:hypothetical protein [Alkalihalobacillus sp. AL-G]WLD91529.1 hypothetical protein MOJ78_10760 [Alkalihalobacillus sp. AL-G]
MTANDFAHVKKALDEALYDWQQMQLTSGDDGAEWAERFERHFYEMIDELKKWYDSLEKKPTQFEELESMPEIEGISITLPGPLQLNFLTELEDIFDGFEKKSFD